MNRLYILFVLCCLICPYGLSGQSPTLTETDTHLLVAFGDYQVRIQRIPFGYDLQHQYQTVMATAAPAMSWQEGGAEGTDTPFGNLKSWEQAGQSLSLEVEVGEEIATLSLSLHPEHISWTCNLEGETAGKLSLNLDLGSAGHWYGGEVIHGHKWPLDRDTVRRELFSTNRNVTAPIWLTSGGVSVLADSYQPLGYGINKPLENAFTLETLDGNQMSYQLLVGADIVDSYRLFVEQVGLPAKVPPRDYFADPIYNTWIAFFFEQNQAGILEYAQQIRTQELPARVLIIDDGWSTAHGNLDFDPQKFPDPKGMMDSLHAMGFKVLLWVTPMVVPQSDNFNYLRGQGYLMTTADGKPGLAPWWHDPAALIDLSHPQARAWLSARYQRLIDVYGVDGFKLDTGDGRYRRAEFQTFMPMTQTEYTDAFLELGSQFTYNEYKVGWSAQDMGIVQRLRDKAPTWTGIEGMDLIVSHGMTLSLLGYPYWSPDMIGGGWNIPFQDPEWEGMDEELFVRWTQASTFMPMMQFSYGPWNLSERTVDLCRRYSQLHQQLGDFFYELAHEAQQTGMPITRPMFFADPADATCYQLPNQFLLGNRFLVAPVLRKNQTETDVYLPAGTWKDFWSETIYAGGKWVRKYPAPIEKLPVFVRVE